MRQVHRRPVKATAEVVIARLQQRREDIVEDILRRLVEDILRRQAELAAPENADALLEQLLRAT
jgi:hypothetical protein